MKAVKEFPQLFAKSSAGKTKIWSISVEEGNSRIFIVKRYGYIDGIIQTDRREVKSGRNIDKSNETTRVQQAALDATSAWNKKKDKKYSESINESTESKIVLPMLAHSYSKRSHNIVWPAYVQPKLDGIRCLARLDRKNGKVVLTSRAGKEFTTLTHLLYTIEQILTRMGPSDILDGELFIEGETFQQITRLVKKERENTSLVKYWVYDIVNKDKFETRMSTLLKVKKEWSHPDIVIVDTINVNNEDQMKEFHNETVSRGFEGTIIRNKEGLYKRDHRSADLQKYKDFLEDDYKIIGVNEAEGRDSGTAIFVCSNGTDPFNVRPRGTLEMRQEMFNNRKEMIGKFLSVRYFELSESGIPRFPVGLGIKEDR